MLYLVLFWASEDAKLNNPHPCFREEDSSRMHLSKSSQAWHSGKEHWASKELSMTGPASVHSSARGRSPPPAETVCHLLLCHQFFPLRLNPVHPPPPWTLPVSRTQFDTVLVTTASIYLLIGLTSPSLPRFSFQSNWVCSTSQSN